MSSLIAPLVFLLACFIAGWGRYRGAGSAERPPYLDAFVLVSRLRGRRWPLQHALPALGLYVMMAFAFVALLRHARMYAAGERDVGLVFDGLKYAAATAALVSRRRWGWWLLQLCCAVVIAIPLLDTFPNEPFGLDELDSIVLGSLLLLYVRRRPAEFGYPAPVVEAVSAP